MLKGVSCPQPSPLFKVFFNSHLTKKSSNCLHLLFKDAEIFFFCDEFISTYHDDGTLPEMCLR